MVQGIAPETKSTEPVPTSVWTAGPKGFKKLVDLGASRLVDALLVLEAGLRDLRLQGEGLLLAGDHGCHCLRVILGLY